MKKILTIIGFLFTLTAFSQNSDGVLAALKAGNAAQFSSHFDKTLDVKFPMKAEIRNMQKADATAAVNQFFSANKITGFDLTSQREMSGTMYIAGKLTGNAKSYNLTVMLKDNLVITVRIN